MPPKGLLCNYALRGCCGQYVWTAGDLWTDCPRSDVLRENRVSIFGAFFGEIRRRNAVSVQTSSDSAKTSYVLSPSLVGGHDSYLVSSEMTGGDCDLVVHIRRLDSNPVDSSHDDIGLELETYACLPLCSFAYTYEGRSLQAGTREIAIATYARPCGIGRRNGMPWGGSFLGLEC
uniref:Uncharacterized protein n=1 Tax=Ananas comosus var. bracteatus TaxID=296719 RepID=A0A6V7NII6_ANACO|nr:unnamed protein product [Ananas comosus var. bracteatus]